VVDVRASDRLEMQTRRIGSATWRVTGDAEPIVGRRGLVGFAVPVERLREPVREDAA
jgi:hypothetical protein